jgi:hypothetical protein
MSRKQLFALSSGVLLLASAGAATFAYQKHIMVFLKVALLLIVLGLVMMFLSDRETT